MRAGNNGITAKTVQNIQFGAGTIHKGLKYTEDTGWNFEESIVGATKGGSSVKITPEFYTVAPDGSSVAVKEFKRKIGETATLDVNLLEINKDMIMASVVGQEAESEIDGYTKIVSKYELNEGDYWDNIAFVGETLDNRNIIVILPNALCTSGLSIDGKAGEENVCKFTFECHGDASESLVGLPYEIYFPNEKVESEPTDEKVESEPTE